MSDTYFYREYRIEMRKARKRWRSLIYSPHTDFPILESPVSLEYCLKEVMVGKAKMVIDRQLGSTA
jgi:hypothetical protein